MKTPVRAEVVNAFVKSLIDVFQAATGLKAHIEPLKLTSDLPPPPGMVVTIYLSGRIIGPTIWSFEPAVARAIAANMLSSAEAPAFDSPECRDAVGELANIVAGNVTNALLEAGYPVELSTPTTTVPMEAQKLGRPTVNVSVNTDAGTMNLLLAVTQE